MVGVRKGVRLRLSFESQHLRLTPTKRKLVAHACLLIHGRNVHGVMAQVLWNKCCLPCQVESHTRHCLVCLASGLFVCSYHLIACKPATSRLQ